MPESRYSVYDRPFPRPALLGSSAGGAPAVNPRLRGAVGAFRRSQPMPAGPSALGVNPEGEFSGPQFQTNLIESGREAGVFDPLGSPALLDFIRANLLQRRGSRVSRALTAADAYSGDDPYLRGYARLSAQGEADDEYERALSDAILRSMMQNQGFLQDITRGYFGQAVNRRDPQPGEPWAAAAGQFLGPFAGAGAARLFR